MSFSLDVLNVSHGGVELVGEKLHNRLVKGPISGVRSRIAHPRALEAGKRFLGSSQIMDHYSGDPWGDPEDKAAFANMSWLGAHAGSPDTIVWDVHSTVAAGPKYHEVGTRALQASMVSAYILGYEVCVVRPDSFHTAVPNAVALESTLLNEADEHKEAARLHAGLGELAMQQSIDELQAVYKTVAPHITFLAKHDIVIKPGDYDPQAIIVNDATVLHKLEAIKPVESFAEYPLEAELKQELGFRNDSKLILAGWNYNNMSPELSDYGEYNGSLRKLGLGTIYEHLPPPEICGQWVEFEAA